MGYWRLVEPHWDRVSLDDAGSFLRDYATMPEASRHLLTAHWLYSEVCNGGFHQFFTNPTGVLAPEALEGLRAVGAAALADIAAEAIGFFPQPYPRDQMVRIALLDTYAETNAEPSTPEADDDDDAWNPFGPLDDRFYSELGYSELRLGAPDGDRFETAADAYAAQR